jgi:hypothetical protein
MKLLLTFLLLMTVTLSVFSQSPEKMTYQAIIRAQNNTLVLNSNVSIKILVRQGASTGTIVYQETHFVKTNNNGLVSLEIGTGSVSIGSFSAIAWEKGPYFIETQVDAKGGTNYNIIGIAQLLSVPYALHTKTAERLVGEPGINPYKAVIIPFNVSRYVIDSDISNTLECTTSATMTLTSGFGNMAIGDTINLEAHNGAVLTIQAASGVTINYTANGSAKFTSAAGNVRFGMLRKIALNSYIISGQ